MSSRASGLAAALLVLLPAAARCDTGYGTLRPPAFGLGDAAQQPFGNWDPQPGDVILSNSTRPGAMLMYTFALSGPPAHVGVVVRLPDGRPAVAEAGGEGVFTTRVTPLDQRVGNYDCSVWVRRRCTPLTAEQSCRLTEFVLAADGGRGIGMGARLGARGPLRTYHLGHRRGIGKRYFCGEFVTEALAHAGAVGPATARPGAVLPRDLFFDNSTNPYPNEFPPLAGWEAPAKWDVCRSASTVHSVASYPVSESVVVGGYVWPGDYHDPRYPDPIPLKQAKNEKSKKEKPGAPSEILPPPRRVAGDAMSAWLQRPD